MSGIPSEILNKYWGYKSFRPLQEEIINSVLEGKDTLALLPTGGGKSVCFQVPALCMDGLCIVVTPLVALMIDQVENLKKRGIGAVEIHSGMHPREITLAFEKCAEGRVKFLYLSPERLDTKAFREMAPYLNVSLIAVDEAHCISQWGYDFRPPYLKISEIRGLFRSAVILALTATAVNMVIDDIQNKLLFRKKNLFRKSFYRENLAYIVYKEEDKLGRLLRLCKSVAGSGIVYVRNRKLTKETAEYLSRNGIQANFYHAGLEAVVRSARQKEWMEEKCRVIVSTNAFGMGIDKPNVRFVVHLDLTDTLEAYFQEAGRAGRDGKKAYSVILYNQSDILDARHYLGVAWPEPTVIRQVYQALGNYFQLAVGSGKDLSFDFDLELFSSSYRFKPLIVFNVLKILEREGYIAMNEAMYESSKAIFLVDREELYHFQLQHREADHLIKALLRSYSGLFTDFVQINEYELARRISADRELVISQLSFLKKSGIIDYIPQRNLPQLVFITERMDADDIGLSSTYYFNRKKDAQAKLEKLIDYVTSDQGCRSVQLLEYFGDLSGKPCGCCDLCLKSKQTLSDDNEFDNLVTRINTQVKSGPVSLLQLVSVLSEFPEKKVVEVTRWMIDTGHLTLENNAIYLADES